MHGGGRGKEKQALEDALEELQQGTLVIADRQKWTPIRGPCWCGAKNRTRGGRRQRSLRAPQ